MPCLNSAAAAVSNQRSGRRLVTAHEEGGERAGDGGDDEDPPELEGDVDDLASVRDRILEGGGDRHDLGSREEERVAEAVDAAPFQPALVRPQQRRADSVHDSRETEGDDHPGEEPSMALAPGA